MFHFVGFCAVQIDCAWAKVEVNSASFYRLGINVDFWELIRVLISRFVALECIVTDGNHLNAIDLT